MGPVSIPAALMLYGLFFVYPLIRGIGMSLTDWDGMGQAKFVRASKFHRLFSGCAYLRHQDNLIFAVGSAVLLNVIGLCYALLMNGNFRSKSLARVIIYLHAIISPLIMGYLVFYSSRGAVFCTMHLRSLA